MPRRKPKLDVTQIARADNEVAARPGAEAEVRRLRARLEELGEGR